MDRAGNWALAFAVVALLTVVVWLYSAIADPKELFDDGLGFVLMRAGSAFPEALAALTLAAAGLGLRGATSTTRLDDALTSLRIHLRIQTIAGNEATR